VYAKASLDEIACKRSIGRDERHLVIRARRLGAPSQIDKEALCASDVTGHDHVHDAQTAQDLEKTLRETFRQPRSAYAPAHFDHPRRPSS
jgi:hypothetical protein